MKGRDTNLFRIVKPYMGWTVIALLYFTLGARASMPRAATSAIMFTAAQWFVYTVNSKLFIPRYFETQRRKFYLMNIAYVTLVSVVLTLLVHLSLRIIPSEGQLPPQRLLFPFILNAIICYIAFWISVFTHLVRREEQARIEIEELKREKAESELRFLKTQINPHFLFNALNNIYSMAYTGDQNAPNMIAMLSDMLRYVLYECESEFISLGKEIGYISSFIEFQQLKTEEKQNISFTLTGINEEQPIAPMLLAPLVENGFKHSGIEKDKAGFVHVALTQRPGWLQFEVRNSIPRGVFTPARPAGVRGIGVENVRNRLKLLYPNRHKLQVERRQHEHIAILELYR